MDSGVSVQKHDFMRNPEKFAKVFGNQKSSIFWNSEKLAKIFFGIIARPHHTEQRLMGLLKEQCAEWRKAPLLCCCNQVQMKVGGQILWNAAPICETSQTCCLMGRRPMKDVLWAATFWTCCSIWFIGWVSPNSFQGSIKNPSIWKESFAWIVPRIRSVRGGNLDGWRTDRRPWGVRDDGRIGNLLEKTQCERGDISQTRRIYFSNRKWTNQNTWKRSGTENIHLDTAATNSRRGSHWLSWRSRRVSSTTSWLTSGCRWSNKRLLVHVGKLHIPPSRWTQSQTSFAERGIIPHSTEVHWFTQNYSWIWMSSKRSALMIIGTLMALETCLILGQVSHNLLY